MAATDGLAVEGVLDIGEALDAGTAARRDAVALVRSAVVAKDGTEFSIWIAPGVVVVGG